LGVSSSDGGTDPGSSPLSAGVFGTPAAVVPVAAACAGELRARERAAAALICVWRAPAPAPAPGEAMTGAPGARSPAGATTPGARRLAARLAEAGLAATACGRLAWLALDAEPAKAVDEVQACRILASTPFVLAVVGARPEHFEPILAALGLSVAVLPADVDPALRTLTGAALPSGRRVVVPPLPPGPSRWAAMAGLARLRSLPELRA